MTEVNLTLARAQNGKNNSQSSVIANEDALMLYKNTLNLNVISRYDPAIKKLLYTTSYCVIYKFSDESQEWIKTDNLGMLTLYLRYYRVPAPTEAPSYQTLQNLFCYGLILMNRNNPECFAIGMIPNMFVKRFFPRGIYGLDVLECDVELNDNLILFKNHLGEIYGLWFFDEEDRAKLFQALTYCLNNTGSIEMT